MSVEVGLGGRSSEESKSVLRVGLMHRGNGECSTVSAGEAHVLGCGLDEVAGRMAGLNWLGTGLVLALWWVVSPSSTSALSSALSSSYFVLIMVVTRVLSLRSRQVRLEAGLSSKVAVIGGNP